ncbi:MAG: hypothetical protein GXO62_01465 [Epsilonproteobacteria bacterium]|nr:hypothetical protein [Campylobacterota bacterium]
MKYIFLALTLFMLGCGGGSGGGSEEEIKTGTFIDAVVINLEYNTSSGIKGVTDKDGKFTYRQGDEISFNIGSNTLGTVKAKEILTPYELADNNTTKLDLIAYIIQNLDTDANPYNNAIILPESDVLQHLSLSLWNESAIQNEIESFKDNVNITFPDISITLAHNILAQNLADYGYNLTLFATAASTNTTATIYNIGTVYDAYVANLAYQTSSNVSGVTNNYGKFNYNDDDNVSFFIGDLNLTIKAAPVITPMELAQNNLTKAITLAYLLQNLDTDGNPTDNIIMLPNNSVLKDLNITSLDQNEVEEKLPVFKEKHSYNFAEVSRTDAYKTLYNNLKNIGYSLPPLLSGEFIDDSVTGLEYITYPSGIHSYTDYNGNFNYVKGDTITFKIGNLIFGTTTAKNPITPYELSENNSTDINLTKLNLIACILQNLDTNPLTSVIELPDPDTLQYLYIKSWNTQDVLEGLNNFKSLITKYNFRNISCQDAYYNAINNLKNLGYVIEPTGDNYPIFNPLMVEVYTIAPVLYAKVTDANGQVAQYDPNKGVYYFNNYVTFPIKAQTTPQTFVDIDFDKNKSANDLYPSFTTLYSYQKSDINNTATISLLSNYLSQNTAETIESLEHKFAFKTQPLVFDENYTLIDENYTNFLIATYLDRIINTIPLPLNLLPPPYYISTTYQTEYNNINNFKNDYLLKIYPNSADSRLKYSIAYYALKFLDSHQVKRADEANKPTIPSILRAPYTILASNTEVASIDVEASPQNVITAAGADEWVNFNTSLSIIDKSPTVLLNDDQFYGRYISKVTDTCYILSDNSGFKFLNTATAPVTQSVLYDGTNKPPYISGLFASAPQYLQRVHIFYSPLSKKTILTVNSLDAAVQFAVFDITNIFDPASCDFNSTDTARQIIPIASLSNNPTFDTALRRSTAHIYTSCADGNIYYADISSFEPNTILGTITAKSLPTGSSPVVPYDLLITSDEDYIFTSTNTGIMLYKFDNANNIIGADRSSTSYSYDLTLSASAIYPISTYFSEGAKDSYQPDLEFIEDKKLLIFTDGYRGVKVLSYKSSYEPMLCGVAYFNNPNDQTHYAKVTSVKYQDGYLYIGLENNGIVKTTLDDILFKHCKE